MSMLYIIGGPARSGKSTLRNIALKDFKISGISTDYIRAMLQEKLPLEISYKNSPDINSQNMLVYLVGFAKEFINYSNEDYVLEGDAIDSKLFYALAETKPLNIKFIFIGYPDAQISNKCNIIRQIDSKTQSWTNSITDSNLSEIISNAIKKSNELREFCKKNNIQFINTSVNFLDEIYKVQNSIFKKKADI